MITFSIYFVKYFIFIFNIIDYFVNYHYFYVFI